MNIDDSSPVLSNKKLVMVAEYWRNTPVLIAPERRKAGKAYLDSQKNSHPRLESTLLLKCLQIINARIVGPREYITFCTLHPRNMSR
jgi:hypothetical protein